MRLNNFRPVFLVSGLCFLVFAIITLITSILSPRATITFQPRIVGTAEVSGLNGVVEETLNLPVNATKDVLTSHHYAGVVTISIRGEGQVDENVFHDAFYRYKGRMGEEFYGFIVDGKNLSVGLYSIHVDPRFERGYQFLYSVGSNHRPIAFRIVNGNEQDTSEFTVEISTVDKISAIGR